MTITKSIISPTKFLMRKDLLKDLGTFTSNYGKKAFLLSDPFVFNKVKDECLSSFSDNAAYIAEFGGQCSDSEIERHKFLASERDYIVAIGGGKTIDTAKALADSLSKPVIIVPTIASTDAPCTAISVIYNEDGSFNRYVFLKRSPDAVFADTSILSAQPPRFFAAGVGDGLATYFEARACWKSQSDNLVKAGSSMLKPSLIGFSIAKLCYETIRDNAALGAIAVKNKAITLALENTIEATIYMSAVGAESGGCAAAHAIHNGMTIIDDLHGAQHGEKVIFGLFTQLIMEGAPLKEIEEVLSIVEAVGLPLTLADLGLKIFIEEEWRKVAEVACHENDTMHNMPFKVTPSMVFDAIIATNAMLEKYKTEKKLVA
ncbi:glycerol dehydrogenase [Acinetobacter pittii]|uniref:glycerol dehydrogenase n=1 Tax=Acinetobacter pittii TaxID=48296 RepID=UPI0032EB534C